MKDELDCLSKYLSSRKLTYGEISALLELKLNGDRCVSTIKVMKIDDELNHSH